MEILLVPVLRSLRDLYDIEGVMPRFQAYVSLAFGETRGEPLPIGAFSPMGQRQRAFLDALIDSGAERVAAEAASEGARRLEPLSDIYRSMLVVTDVPRNGWTQRHLTDAEWRFSNKYDALPKNAPPVGFDRWVSVQLWTDERPTAEYVRRETMAAIYRAAHQRHIGLPRTLGDMICQEGRAYAFAGYAPDLDADDLSYSREVIKPLLRSAHYPTCFTAFYGDEAARSVGYEPLGLSAQAGFNVGLARAQEHGCPERWLLDASTDRNDKTIIAV